MPTVEKAPPRARGAKESLERSIGRSSSRNASEAECSLDGGRINQKALWPIKNVKQWNWEDYICTILFLLLKKVLFHVEHWNCEHWSILSRSFVAHPSAQRNHKSFTEKNWQVRTVGACRAGSMTSGQQIYLTISLLHVYQECTATIDSKEWNVNMVCIYTCKTFLIDQIMAQFWGGKDFSSIQKYKHVYVTHFWILCFEMIWIPKQLFWILQLCWIYVSSFLSRSW